MIMVKGVKVLPCVGVPYLPEINVNKSKARRIYTVKSALAEIALSAFALNLADQTAPLC
jgi:membrane-anchored protein YejM (alkaline phosphatase superfamily)